MCLSCSHHCHSGRRDICVATYRTITTVLFDVEVSPPSVAARYQYFGCLFVIEIMRRFLVKKTGDCGSPPNPKMPKADSERLVAAREYEDRRRRGFKAAWRDEFAWLTYEPAPADSDSNGAPAATGSASSDGTTTKPQAQPLSQYKMFCTPCRASYGVSASMRLPDRGLFRKYSKGPFVIGGTNMKRTTLTAHEASDGHSVAVEHERNRTARTGTSIAEQSIQKMNRAVVDKLDKLFRNAHAIAKNNRPFSDYVWMATLDERKGLFLGETYRNERACKEFMNTFHCQYGKR